MSVNKADSNFTADDLYRLEQSLAWQQQPALIEALCKLLHDIDPMGIWSAENPHARTEYLQEAAAISNQTTGISSERDLGTLVASIFMQKFGNHELNSDWNGLAKALLPTLEKFKA